MITPTDDVSESRAQPAPSNAAGSTANNNILIEEDPSTSSVQYCCDGCSTVPIVRRRWHCTICPDFDLCETCYEVLDADRFPPPHSRDHAMTAIPIELESMGGDGAEMHFSLDELTDPGSVRGLAARDSTERGTRESSLTPAAPSSIHVLEMNDAAELVNHRVVSISASKRVVNSLLLRGLIEELNGWMEVTSGLRAIPIMQLFYRLSSAVGGPFVDGVKTENLDLEKFVRWLLDEINLRRPFPASARSPFGEVAILVFMFFTLMFRNWHQPSGSGSDSSSSQSKPDSQDKGFTQVSAFSSTPSTTDELEKEEFTSQLVRACSHLRNQEFLNYLLDILQQLMHVFKSSVSTESGSVSGPGCGSLLTVRRELPAGNFSPFFSDSYAKSHPKDLFADYHKLLLENTFRLVYSMVRPEKHDKSTEKDNKAHRPAISGGSKDLKLEGYQDVLCNYISNPNTTFVRRYARRLFLHICGSKTHYYSTRDAWQYSHEVKRLYKIVNKSGGFKNPVPYERSVKLIKCLTTLCEVAASRPKNWQKYCLKHPDILPFLTKSVFYFGEESVFHSLKLLNLAFYTGKELNHTNQKLDCGTAEVPSAGKSDSKKKKKAEEGGESSNPEKSCVDMEHALEMFITKDAALLRQFVDTFLLEWSSASVRNEAKCVLYGVWHHARGLFKETILKALLHKVRCLPMYGQNIMEYTDLMAWLLGKGAVTNTCTGTCVSKTQEKEREVVSKCLTSEVVSSIFETLHSQNELLANHPNSRIYNTLSTLVEFDGYYLESEPCVSCSCPDVPYTRMKLETIKSETKYTDNRIIVKCTGCFMIQSLTMNVHDARKSKSVKVLNLYYNNRPGTDLSELKNNWSLWKKAKSCHLTANQTELKVEFSIPITACNLMIELDSFYENLQASSLESLQCPRCSRAVTDKHGICSNCHENAYQCRQCRNINYENLDSFLCNECGYSKYGRFEFHFMAKPSFSFDNMENDDDMRKGLAAIETESENAHRRYQQLLGFKKPLVKLVSSIGEHEMDSQQKDTVQQMMVSLPGPSCKVNRKIALLGVLYGEKCKAAFDSVSKSVQTLQGLRRVLMTYLHQKSSDEAGPSAQSLFANLRSTNNCYGCATTFITQCLELLQVLTKHPTCKKQLISSGILSELFENNIHHGPRATRVLARAVISAFSEGDAEAVAELNGLIKKKVMYCLEHHRSMDVASATHEELLLLSETCAMVDEFWESRLRIAFQILFSSIKVGAKHPAISENIILPCLRIVSQACTPPRSDSSVDGKEQDKGKSRSSVLQPRNEKAVSDGNEKIGSDSGSHKAGQDIPLLSYSEWERGASYLDFVRRQYKVSQVVKAGPAVQKTQKSEYLALKYGLRWKRRTLKHASRSDFSKFALGSWVSELILSACSQPIRSEVSTLINLLFPVGSARQFQLLNLLVTLLPATLDAGESAAEYFELFFSMVETEAARLVLTVRGCLRTICGLITKEVANTESQERSLAVDISQGFILHKLIELLNKFLEVPNIRARY
jgi:E3 ubiquitin-protein ligase UBR4